MQKPARLRTAPLLITLPIAWLALAGAVMAAPFASQATAQAPLDILWPAADPTPRESAAQRQSQARRSANPPPPHEQRSGSVMLDMPALHQLGLQDPVPDQHPDQHQEQDPDPRSASRATRQAPPAARAAPAPTRLRLGLFADAQIEVDLSAQSHPTPEVLSLSGRAPGHDIDSFTLTMTPESYLITYADPDSSLLYRVVGDSTTGQGQVTEIDRDRLPPRLHEPPLVKDWWLSEPPDALPASR